MANYQITKEYDINIFPTSTGKANTMTYKIIADRHLNQLATND
jgi:hypothetical protein